MAKIMITSKIDPIDHPTVDLESFAAIAAKSTRQESLTRNIIIYAICGAVGGCFDDTEFSKNRDMP